MKMEKIMQDIFKRLINEIFLLKFKPYGWKKQGSNFRYIDASGLGRVINFQKSKWNTADELEFFINYGLYIEIDNQLVNKFFKEYECQFRARTGLDKGSFHLNSDTDFETLQRRVEQALDEAINQFDKVGNKEHYISMILSGELQKYTGTPIMNYYTCKLFSDMGYYEDIYDYVKEKGGPYFEMLTAEIESKTKH